jgi:hypothetical protein
MRVCVASSLSLSLSLQFHPKVKSQSTETAAQVSVECQAGGADAEEGKLAYAEVESGKLSAFLGTVGKVGGRIVWLWSVVGVCMCENLGSRDVYSLICICICV